MRRKLKAVIAAAAASIGLMIMPEAMAADKVKDTKYDFITELFTVLEVIDGQFADVNTPESLISANVFNGAVTSFFGNDSLKVRPGDRIVTMAEAAEAFAKGLGVSEPVFDTSSKLEYKKHITPSQEKELLDDVAFAASEGLNAEEFMQLLFNSMYIEPIWLDNLGEIQYRESYAERNEIERVKGIVYANENASVKAGVEAGKECVYIGNSSYYDGDTGIEGYLGREAEVFVIEETVIAARVTDYNSEMLLDAKDIVEVSGSYITYTVDGKIKKLKIEPDYVQMYNGNLKLKKEPEIIKSADLCRVTLLSNNNDEIYDVIFIEDLEVYQVGSINKEELVITDKDGVWRKDFSDIAYTVTDGETDMDFADIKTNDVIYIAEDENGTLAKIYVSSQTVSGSCTALSVGDLTCVIDDTKYDISASAGNDIKTGSEGKFYIGAFGRIEFAESININIYGLIYNVYYDEDIENYAVKILNQNGEDKIYTLSEKTKFYGGGINGQKLSTVMIDTLNGYINRSMGRNETAYGYGMAAPIVMYRENDGVISSISMPVLFDETKAGTDREYYSLQSATALDDYLYTQAEHIYMGNTGGFYPSYRNSAYNDGAQKFVNADTVVFSLTVGSDNLITKESIREAIVTKSGNADFSATWIYANFYNMDIGNNAEVMVKYDMGRELTNYAANLTVVKKVKKAVGSDGEEYYLIEGYNGGKEAEYYVKPDAEIFTNFLNGFIDTVPKLTLDDIGEGDVLSLASDSKGNIGYVSVMHLGSVEKADYNRYHNSGNCESGREVMFGTVVGLSSDTMVLRLDTNANSAKVTRFYIKNYKNASVYQSEGTGEIYLGNASDILLGDSVYVRLYHSSPREIVVR